MQRRNTSEYAHPESANFRLKVPAQSICKVMNRTQSAKAKVDDKDAKQEQERLDYAKRVLDHHETSTRSASTSSHRARNAEFLSVQSIHSTKAVLKAAKYEVKKFNDDLKEVLKREEDRLEKEDGYSGNNFKRRSLDIACTRSDSLTVDRDSIEPSPTGSPGHTPYPSVQSQSLTRKLLRSINSDVDIIVETL